MSVGERDIRGNSLGELGTLIHNAGGIFNTEMEKLIDFVTRDHVDELDNGEMA